MFVHLSSTSMNFLTLEKSYHLRVFVVPLKPKFQYFQVDHLSELDHADEDDDVLPQASHFKDRVFLNEITERKHVLDFLTGDISPGQFTRLPDMTSENGEMLKNLVNDLDTRFQGEIPKAYHRFMKNICKPTSVAGLLQCTGPAVLQYLHEFANKTLNLRNRANKAKLQIVAKELPAFWPMLLGILNQEKANFLNPLVSTIVKKLLDIRCRVVFCNLFSNYLLRNKTFRNAEVRGDDMYVEWSDSTEEHPTQCYPNFKIFRHPKKYRVKGQQIEY